MEGFLSWKVTWKKDLKKPAKNGLLDSTGFYWIPMGLSQHLPSHPLRLVTVSEHWSWKETCPVTISGAHQAHP